MFLPIRSIPLLLLLGCVACSTARLKTNQYYVLADVPQRNLVLRFDPDGRYALTNRVHGSLRFGSAGRWVQLANGHLLLRNDQDSLGVLSTLRVAAPYGARIDLGKALSNRAYIFPVIRQDTVEVLRHHLIKLHGYPFKLDNRSYD